VHDDVRVAFVDVGLGEIALLAGILDGERVELEDFRQESHLLGSGLHQIHPEDSGG